MCRRRSHGVRHWGVASIWDPAEPYAWHGRKPLQGRVGRRRTVPEYSDTIYWPQSSHPGAQNVIRDAPSLDLPQQFELPIW